MFLSEKSNSNKISRLLKYLFIFLAFIGFVFISYGLPDSPEEAYKEFINPDRVVAEDQIADPLILAGAEITPLLISKLKSKSGWERRRYIVGALGSIGDKQAIPYLRKIASNEGYSLYFRCDALIAIYNIKGEVNLAYMKRLVRRLKCAKSVKVNDMNEEIYEFYPARSFFDALLGRHK